MTENPLQAINARTLMGTNFPEPVYVVEGLISQGVTFLCGPSKIGKSWLVLWLGLCVAQGQPVWEDYPTRQSDVLYLCLEDNLPRVQRRLAKITDEAPDSLYFATYCGKLGDGLEEQILDFLKEHPETKLVIIDTFQKVRISGGAQKSGMYANDYDDVAALKNLADRKRISIVLVHHLRKLADKDDPFNEISGSTGIMGAADTSMVFKKEARSDNVASLLVTGRDVEDQKIWLQLVDCVWQLSQSTQETQVPLFVFQVVSFMSERESWEGTATQLLAEMGLGSPPANQATRLLRDNDLFLRQLGIKVEDRRNRNTRILCLSRYEPSEEDFLEVEGERPEQVTLEGVTV